MRFLADESCDFAVVRALRADGYDVTAVAYQACVDEGACALVEYGGGGDDDPVGCVDWQQAVA